ncbi:hypothetical protein [Metabacillus sp. SLBN-84]
MSVNKSAATVASRVEGKELIIERMFNAPRELVFRAYAEPDLLAAWWGS